MRISAFVVLLVSLFAIAGLNAHSTLAFQDNAATATVESVPDDDSDQTVVVNGDDAEDQEPLTEISRNELLALLILGVVPLIMFLGFLYTSHRSQGYAYWTIHQLGRKGIPLRLEQVQSISRSGEGVAGLTKAADGTSPPVSVVIRAASVTVSGAEGATAIWNPSDTSLTVDPATGLSTTITGSKKGTFQLTVTVNDASGSELAVSTFDVSVDEQPVGASGAVPVPFVGAGTLTAAVLMVLLIIVGSLGILGIIDGQNLVLIITAVVAGLIGAGAATVAANRDSDV
jgi:hypothetical protein